MLDYIKGVFDFEKRYQCGNFVFLSREVWEEAKEWFLEMFKLLAFQSFPFKLAFQSKVTFGFQKLYQCWILLFVFLKGPGGSKMVHSHANDLHLRSFPYKLARPDIALSASFHILAILNEMITSKTGYSTILLKFLIDCQ